MTDLATILDEPIAWQSATTDADIRSFLNDLQANILKGHGRQHSGHIFMSFTGMEAGAVAAILRSLAQHCTSAYDQLRTNKRMPPHLDGGTVRCLFLTANGFKALGAHAAGPGLRGRHAGAGRPVERSRSGGLESNGMAGRAAAAGRDVPGGRCG